MTKGHALDGQDKEVIPQNMSSMTRQRPNNLAPQDPSDMPCPMIAGHELQESRELCGVNNSNSNSSNVSSSKTNSNPSATDQRRLRDKRTAPKSLETRAPCTRTISILPVRPKLTEDDLLCVLGNWVARKTPSEENTKLADCFRFASTVPPVTRKSLSELDIGAIIMNAKLRHDVNFDRDLHFRPNFDGEKGKEKIKEAENYWTALRVELQLYNLLFHCGDTPDECEEESKMRVAKASEKRIPIMFEAIRDILKNLIPERDQSRVNDQLDVLMLMQQIEKGVCDLVALAKWLSELLKAHCAPMRDDWVNKMVLQAEIAVETNQSDHMVNALRELLGILEAMKLDVANHQIRHLRMLLIEDTINFEQKYHLSRITRDRINVDASKQWFSHELHRARQLAPSSKQQETSQFQLETFLGSFLSLLLSNNPQDSFPDTFYLDFDRLRSLKNELEDFVYYDICCQVFNDLMRRLGRSGRSSDSTYQTLRQTLLTIVRHNGMFPNRQWAMNLENIAFELVRLALHECHLPSSYNLHLVQVADESLRRVFSSPLSGIFALHAERVHRCIAPMLLDKAKRHLNLSPVDMFNSLVVHLVPPPPPPPPPPLQPVAPSNHTSTSLIKPTQLAATVRQIAPSKNDHLADIVRRITHVAVLHWRIWSPIVYTLADQKPSQPSSGLGIPTLSNSTSRRKEADKTTSISRQRSVTLPFRQQSVSDLPSLDREATLPATNTAKDSQKANLGG